MTAARESGFTLVEMMVSLVIGLAVVGALLAAHMASLQSGRHSDAIVQITEDATLALAVMRPQIAQAGFGVPRGAAGAALIVPAFPPIQGCARANFDDDDVGVLAPATCGAPVAGTATAAAADSLEVAYEASVAVNDASGRASNGILGGPSGHDPLDCLGNSFPKTHDAVNGDYWLEDSKFYVAGGNLYCHGPGNAAAAAIVQNVETMQVRYGMAAAPIGQPGSNQVAWYDVAPAVGSPAWGRVIAVAVCVQVRSAAKVLDPAAAATLGAWVDCQDKPRSSRDGYLRRTFSTTIVLQSRMP